MIYLMTEGFISNKNNSNLYPLIYMIQCYYNISVYWIHTHLNKELTPFFIMYPVKITVSVF